MDDCILTDDERRALVLIRRGKCFSRADLSRHLHVSRPTASIIVEKLIKCQALYESGSGKSLRGKAPTMLAPVPGYRYSIGLDLGYARKMAGVLLDGNNQVVQRMETDLRRNSLCEIQKQAMEMISRFEKRHPVSSIGVALPGIIDPATEIVVDSINPILISRNIRELFSEWVPHPVTVENRSRAAAFSEAFGGAADQQQNFVLCSLGKSVGATFWLNGTVFQGTHGAAGEIRSMYLANGQTLEDALSLEKASRYSEEKLVSICTDGIRQLTEIMDLELFVLTGRFTDFGMSFLRKLTQRLSVFRKCRVVFSKYGHFSSARGIAMTAAENILFPEGEKCHGLLIARGCRPRVRRKEGSAICKD